MTERVTPEDITYHIANSVEGYKDQNGYYFSVRDQDNCLFVDVYYNDEPFQKFMLECKEVN